MFNGVNKKFKYKRMETCEPCNGKGGSDITKCDTCKGRGVVIQIQQTQFGVMQTRITCPTCSGDGEVIKTKCNTCNGKGLNQKETTIDVDIKHGISNGDTLVVNGMGHGIKNGEYGRLLIVIGEVKHKDYIRVGHDLRGVTKLNYSDLVLGTKVDIKTIEGKIILVTIPELSHVGDNLRIQSKGMKLPDSEVRGDMIIELDIEIPTEISDEERELLEKLKKIKK